MPRLERHLTELSRHLDYWALRKALESHDTFLKAGKIERKKLLRDQIKEVQTANKIIELKKEGATAEEIKKRLGLRISSSQISRRSKLKQLPFLANFKLLTRPWKERQIETSHVHAIELASLYSKRISNSKGVLAFSDKDKLTTARVARLFSTVTRGKVSYYHYKNAWKVLVAHKKLADWLEKMTGKRTQAPEAHDETLEKRIAAIKGIILGSKASAKNISITLPQEKIAGQVIALFAEHDIFPGISKEQGMIRIRIGKATDLKKLLELKVLLAKHEKIARELKPGKKVGRTIKEYEDAVKKLIQAEDFAITEKETGINDSAILQWARGVEPKEFKRYAKAFLTAKEFGSGFPIKYPLALERGLSQIGLSNDASTSNLAKSRLETIKQIYQLPATKRREIQKKLREN